MAKQKAPTPVRINSRLEYAIMKEAEKKGTTRHALIIEALEIHFKTPNKNYLVK